MISREQIEETLKDVRRGLTRTTRMMAIGLIIFGIGAVVLAFFLSHIPLKEEPLTEVVKRAISITAMLTAGITIIIVSWAQGMITEKIEQRLQKILLAWPKRIPELVPPPGTEPVAVTEMRVQEHREKAAKRPPQPMPTAEELKRRHLSPDDPPPDAA